MHTVVITGQVSFHGDEPLRARLTAFDESREVAIEADGTFRMEIPIAADALSPASVPEPAALEAALPELMQLAVDADVRAAILEQLSGTAPARDVDASLLGLHALAQGPEALEGWGAGPAVRAWMNAKLEIVASDPSAHVLATRELHLSEALATHPLALTLFVPAPMPKLMALPESVDDWRTRLDRLWAQCQERAGPENIVDVPIQRIHRGRASELRHALDTGDWLAHPNGKFPHRYGVVGRVTWRTGPLGHPFTGIFAHGAEGLIRLGSGLNHAAYNIPGLALKLPVTGDRSRDIAALYRAEGQGSDGDFFRNPLHTRVPRPSRPANTSAPAALLLEQLQRGLERTSETVLDEADRRGSPLRLPLEHLAEVTQDGEAVSAPNAPFELDFVPTPEVRAAFEPPPSENPPRLREQLAKLRGPLPLYRVFGIERDPGRGDERWDLGEIHLDTELVPSRGGDLHLHFEHFYPRRSSPS